MRYILLSIMIAISFIQKNNAQASVKITPLYKVQSLYEPLLLQIDISDNQTMLCESLSCVEIEAYANGRWRNVTPYQRSHIHYTKFKIEEDISEYKVIDLALLLYPMSKISDLSEIKVRGKYYLGEGLFRYTNEIVINIKEAKEDIALLKTFKTQGDFYSIEHCNIYNKSLNKSTTNLNLQKIIELHIRRCNSSNPNDYFIVDTVNQEQKMELHIRRYYSSNPNDYFIIDTVQQQLKFEFSEHLIEQNIDYYKNIIEKTNYNTEKQLAIYYKKINEITLAYLYSNTLQNIYSDNMKIEKKERISFCKKTFQNYCKKFDYHYDNGLFNMNRNIDIFEKNKR